ncbi:MAG TPA: ABC transporter ATP-binding protein [Solirubrobacteraceae bacterium]|nr:ABC transporter ATP-binding protein [Solirubrobacteraceae bacterium]
MVDAALTDRSTASASPAIAFSGVSKQYGAHTAVESLDLEINEGEFFCLLGPSGCGKTTTLNLLGGFAAASTGEIRIRGELVNRTPPHRRKVNTVFQSYALFPHLNVRDNVAFGLRMAKVPRSNTDTRVLEALTLVALEAYADRYPAQLSGGQQQRVAVARALVNRPAVLLLDEPLGSLDLKLRKRLQVELSQIQREIGTTFVFVTHDQGEAMAMADRIAIMNEGRVEQIGTAKEIYQQPASRFVADFIGESNFIAVEWHDGVVMASHDKAPLPSPDTRDSGSGTLMVRPESVRLESASPSDPGLLGTVVKVSFLGNLTRVSIDCAAAEDPIIVDMSAELSEQVREESLVRLRWEAEAAVLFHDVQQDSRGEDTG